jgi:hypothetical protein
MINPFTLNPLGTAVGLGETAHSIGKIAAPGTFGRYDPHTDPSPFSITNPLIQSFFDAATSPTGKSFPMRVAKNIALYNLYHGLRHPGSGSVFPGSRGDVLGHFVGGSVYPRKYDPQVLKEQLERMNINHPEKLVPQQLKDFKKATGQEIPQEATAAYLRAIPELQAVKNFKSDYADKHNASSYRRLPPANQAQAALDYIKKVGHLPAENIQQYQSMIDQAPSDAYLKQLASSLWGVPPELQKATAAKLTWTQLMTLAKQKNLTKKK